MRQCHLGPISDGFISVVDLGPFALLPPSGLLFAWSFYVGQLFADRPVECEFLVNLTLHFLGADVRH